MKIYAIQRGCYSDKEIITCTTDYKKALKVKEIYDRVDDCVTIFTYEDCQEITLPMFNVIIENGILDNDYTWNADYENEENDFFADDVNGNHHFYIRAESKEQAEKIALDKFYMWKAEKENLV